MGATRFLPVLTALLLAACGTAPIRHQVLTPPPSAPRLSFFVEKPDVQSRETGDEAWARNRRYEDLLGTALREALREKGKALAVPPADTVRAKVYLAYGNIPVKVAPRERRRTKPHVEVRLQLVDAESGSVRYSTHTNVPLAAPGFIDRLFGETRDSDEVIREALEKSARDFVSRL